MSASTEEKPKYMRRGRPPRPDQPFRRITFMMTHEHADMVADLAASEHINLSDALAMILDGEVEIIEDDA